MVFSTLGTLLDFSIFYEAVNDAGARVRVIETTPHWRARLESLDVKVLAASRRFDVVIDAPATESRWLAP